MHSLLRSSSACCIRKASRLRALAPVFLSLRPAGLVVANERYDARCGRFSFSITFDCQGDRRTLVWLGEGEKNASYCIMELICDVAERAHELRK